MNETASPRTELFGTEPSATEPSATEPSGKISGKCSSKSSDGSREDKKSFVLRIDSLTMKALERWAEDEFRSVNGQLQWIIADALRRYRK